VKGHSGQPVGLRSALAIVFLNRYAVLVVNFISTMILARLVAPAETGLFSVAASVALLAQAIRDFGVGEFLVQEKDLTPHKIRTAFGLTLCLAWTLGLVIFLLRGSIASLYGTPRLGNLIAIVCCSFVVAPFSSTVLALLNREMAFGILLRISLASSLANAIVSIGLAYQGWGATALTFGMLAMNVTTAVVATLSARSWDHFVPSLREWRTLASFGAYISSGNVVNQLTARLPDLIIGRLLGYGPLGLYNRGNGVVTIFYEMVVAGVQTVAFPAFAAAHRAGEDVRQPYLRAAALITGTALPVLALVAIVAKPLVWCLLGPNWLEAAPLIPPLAVSYAVVLLAPMAGLYLSATGWVRMIPRIAIAVQLAQLTAIACTAWFSIMWVAVGSIGYGLLNLGINTHYLRKASGIGFRALLRAAAKSFCVTVLCAVPAAGVTALPGLANEPLLTLLAGLGTGAVAWCAAVVLVQHPIVKELHLLLREVLHAVHRPA
jgi:O-antigen/teichoic acid export membrane protein